jgi:hypothetical protein
MYVSKRLTAREKVVRDGKIVADRARGLGWALIADRYGLTERQCQNISTHYFDTQPKPRDADPLTAVKETIASCDAIIEDLALVAESATHDAVRLGAIKARQYAVEQRFRLKQAVGLIPRNLGLFVQEIDIQHVVMALDAVIAKHDPGVEFHKDLIAALRDDGIGSDGLVVRN